MPPYLNDHGNILISLNKLISLLVFTYIDMIFSTEDINCPSGVIWTTNDEWMCYLDPCPFDTRIRR